MDYQTFVISPQFSFYVREGDLKNAIPKELAREVDEVWEQELLLHQGTLFNGQILSLSKLDTDALIGEFVDYKYYIAHLRRSDLSKQLKICPIGVSGITVSDNKVLFAQREAAVSLYPLFYELAPSGGIDPTSVMGNKIVIEHQIISELWEETGIVNADIVGIQPHLIIQDFVLNMIDVGVRIKVKPHLCQKTLKPTREYRQFFWVGPDELNSFVKEHKNEFVPTSLILLKSEYRIQDSK